MKTWNCQYWDEDTESWEYIVELPPSQTRQDAEREARYWAANMCGKVKTRAVEQAQGEAAQ